LGEVSDADYYDQYAQGYDGLSVNAWADILRYFNDLGLYNRSLVTVFIYLCASFFIPALINITIKEFSCTKKIKSSYAYVVIWMWPTLYIYSLDIFRDVIILCLTGLGILFGAKVLKWNKTIFINTMVFLGISITAFTFRPYLGFAIFTSLIVTMTTRRVNSWKFFWAFLFGVVGCDYIGLLDPIHQYRGDIGWSGGSSFGITFYGSHGLDFFLLLTINFVYQVLGFSFANDLTVLVFIFESIPFMFFSLYAIKNQSYFDRRESRYILAFALLYAIAFLVGNDNLGTALRLRMPLYYLSILAFLYIYFKKTTINNALKPC
jgi:hypothetical protein